MAWNRRQTEAGLITVMIGPTVVSESARLLDPSAPWVLLPDHCPAVEHEWQEMALPLVADELLSPRTLLARRPTFDVLLSTEEFLAVASRLDGIGAVGGGISLGQFRKHPTTADFLDARPRVRADRLRAFDLVVWIELPHAREIAQVTTTCDEEMDAALARSGL